MTQYLPPNLLALFAPRDPIPYVTPAQKLPHEKKLPPYQGVSQFLNEFEDPKDTPPPTRVETRDERKERKRKERAEQVAYKLEQDLALWDPKTDPNTTSSPFKTIFVARINYDTSESKLRREFEAYGPVKKIRLLHNQKTGMPCGYAFVEYEHEADMHSAYKHADGKKIDGRRVLVDIERGRTIEGWRPRRLGGGLGGTRRGGPDVNTKYSGRDDGFGAREDRDRSRSRDRDRPRRRRSQSRNSRDRGGGVPERRRRSRSRDRRRRSRSKERKKDDAPAGPEEDRKPRRRRSRSRDRAERADRGERGERDRHRRSRSRERKRRRSRSPRERKPRSRSRERALQQEVPVEDGAAQEGPYPENPDYTEEGYPMLRPEEIKKEPGYENAQLPVEPVEQEAPAPAPVTPENGQAQYEYNEYGSYPQE